MATVPLCRESLCYAYDVGLIVGRACGSLVKALHKIWMLQTGRMHRWSRRTSSTG